MFTVCVLLYGDYPDLARRCLSGIVQLPAGEDWVGDGVHVAEIRVACNEVSSRTEAVLQEFLAAGGHHRWHVIRQGNVYKYPAMRRLFYEAPNSISTPYVMWFDDDSYLTTPTALWLGMLTQAMNQTDIAGTLARCALRGGQHRWIAAQPWYTGQPVAPARLVYFPLGGWWCVRYSALERYRWPPAELQHCGGDVMMGEYARQQGLRVLRFTDGVAVNADAEGRSHQSPRRGRHELPVGVNYGGL